MDREYPFLFCSKSGFWLEYQMMRQNIFEKQKRQTPKMTFVYILKSVTQLKLRIFVVFYTFSNCKSTSISAKVLACEMAPRSLAAPDVPRR